MMRVVQNAQMQIGEVDMSHIRFDPKSRDDIPRILRGLQHLWMDRALRKEIVRVLEEGISPQVDKRNGRPGMTLWRILVCGVLRLDLNADYDRLHELVNEINQIVVNAGHVLVNNKDGEALRGRCDSFVVETDVHYPTDINVLFDAMRKVVRL